MSGKGESAEGLHGFEAPDGDVPAPAIRISDDVRERMASVLAAVICFKTPEEIVGYLRDGFPAEVREALEREHELDEIYAHIDVLLCVQQSPALAA